MMTAYEWGLSHGSCLDALDWRESLGPEATQADAWGRCERGDWLLWQWSRLPPEQIEATRPVVQRVLDGIVTRAIRRGQRALRGVREPWAREWRRWARGWLTGVDRSWASAWAVSDVTWSDKEWFESRANCAATIQAVPASWAAAAAAWAAWATAAAEETSRAAVMAAEEEAETERRIQARDIHRELPEWLGKGEK